MGVVELGITCFALGVVAGSSFGTLIVLSHWRRHHPEPPPAPGFGRMKL